MIERNEVDHLARLAQIAMDDAEKERLRADLDAVLGYVSEIKEVSGEGDAALPDHRNSMRDDGEPHARAAYSSVLLEQAPMQKGGYVRVKKILREGR